MSREVRRVPMGWQHPGEWVERYRDGRVQMVFDFKPLYGRKYADAMKDYRAHHSDFDHREPSPDDYMPEFEDDGNLGLCMYETCSEGTPISPVFETPEELARWLADTGASAFGSRTATYDQWLSTVRRGWAFSGVSTDAGMVSGVEALAPPVK